MMGEGAAQVTTAWRKGRVDAVVQSTDKNFMVPVGGAVIAAPKHNTALVEAVNKVGLQALLLHSGFN
jgi:O-phospho-L-seryl-tRNASec:L-selenocysteinyl-tRNA synthase